MKRLKIKDSPVMKFRKLWLKKGYELINITKLCDVKMGESGSCNDINEPDETIHHIRVLYRDDIICNVGGEMQVIDDDNYVLFLTERWNKYEIPDFIIFRKVKIN